MLRGKIGTFLRACGLALVLGASPAFAQQLRVTSPNNGDFLGQTNTIRFTINGATSQARVVATVTNASTNAVLFDLEGSFDPDADNQITGSLELNFDDSTPEALYNIKVEHFQGNALVGTVNIQNVTVDVERPKFFDVFPLSGSFVRGTVTIGANLDEANVDRWTVNVNNRAIPNNTGNSSEIRVLWNTDGIENDGQQTISIRVEDKANNTGSRSINVTVDRVAPTIQVLTPSGNQPIRPSASIPIAIDIIDQAQNSVHYTGVNVTLRAMDGTFLQRAARRSVRANGNNLQWFGRIRSTNRLPDQFKIVVTAVDRAGNPALTQEVIVTIGSRTRPGGRGR